MFLEIALGWATLLNQYENRQDADHVLAHAIDLQRTAMSEGNAIPQDHHLLEALEAKYAEVHASRG